MTLEWNGKHFTPFHYSGKDLMQVLHDLEIMHRQNLWFNEKYAEAYRRYQEQHPDEVR